ncbi:MAG TPA: hypothetical protein CFH81_00360 [Sulfurovum sp. UBA12169]|nr:MAG TPA: hypothetical protein CFH81_00360 [Sulfurovum sp. UBA12169]
MGKKYISQVELAAANGVSKQHITNLKKRGIFDACMDGKKILRDCALQAYISSKDPARDSQREANQKDKDKEIDETTVEIETGTDTEIKDSYLYNGDNIRELKLLLRGKLTSGQKVQIINTFWAGKLNQQKYMEGEKRLMPKEQIIKDNQRILKAFRDKALALPTKMSLDLLGLKDKKEAAAIIESYIYELLEELSQLEDENQ